MGAGFVQIDHDGRVIAAAGPIGLQDARLRRAQALAAGNGIGLAIAREVTREKLSGQRTLLDRLPETDNAEATLGSAIERVDSANTIERLRLIEAETALAYWSAWARVEVRFARKRSANRVVAGLHAER